MTTLATPHRSSADYIDRTIATVRNHRDADNCWPQWANIFADEIEDLRGDVARLEAELARLQAERDEYAERLAWHREERDAYLKGNLWVRRAAEERERAEAAEAEVTRLQEGLRPFVEDYDFHAAPYLADNVDGEEARVLTARTIESLVAHQRVARSLLADNQEQA